METIFKKAELIIFDLDGTLYEDTDHFQYYAEQLMKQLPNDVQSSYLNEYEQMVAGKHIVTIGKVYDVLRDHVIKLDAINSTVIQAWTWEGEELESETIKRIYPNAISLDFDSMIAIGDGWWLPSVCARHFGAQDTQKAYVATKDYMATDQFKLTKIPGLREGLLHLKNKKNIVLVTNSEKDDVKRLLKNLDLDNVFEDVVTEARKPQFTLNQFNRLSEKYNLEPEQVISIGDNYINEIAPALKLGMQSVFIDFHEFDYPEYDGLKVKSISDLIENMIKL